jgi:hypothetical protein
MSSKKDVLDTKKSIRKLDRIVTSLLLGGIIASIYGIKRSQNPSEQSPDKSKADITRRPSFGTIIKMIIFGVKTPAPAVERKKSLFAEIISLFLKR